LQQQLDAASVARPLGCACSPSTAPSMSGCCSRWKAAWPAAANVPARPQRVRAAAPGRGERRALTAAEAALERIRALDSESIRVSIGLAVYPTHCHDRNGLFSGAGDALTEAMREGVDWVRLFQPASIC
jgi:hypothetical protein